MKRITNESGLGKGMADDSRFGRQGDTLLPLVRRLWRLNLAKFYITCQPPHLSPLLKKIAEMIHILKRAVNWGELSGGRGDEDVRWLSQSWEFF